MKAKHLDEFSKARDYAYRLLSYRARSTKEMKGRLCKRGYSQKVINELIAYLEELNYLNDREFARSWVNNRLLSKPVGMLRLRFELRSKGIEQELINKTLNEIKDSYNEYELANQLVKSRLKRYSRLEKPKQRQRLYSYLKRRGFGHEVILEVIQNL